MSERLRYHCEKCQKHHLVDTNNTKLLIDFKDGTCKILVVCSCGQKISKVLPFQKRSAEAKNE